MNTKQTFPESCPRSFPFKAGRGHSIITMYRVKRAKGDEFKLPYLEDGQRKFHSFSEYSEARAKGNEMMDQHASGQALAIILTNEDKVIYTRAMEVLRPLKLRLDTAVLQVVEAVKALEGTGASVVEAARFYSKKHAKALTICTVGKAVDDFIEAKKQSKRADRYIEDLRHRLGKLKEAFSCNLSNIAQTELEAFMGALKSEEGKQLSPRSRNNFRGTLVTFFRWAIKKKYLPADWTEFASVEMVEDGEGEIEIFTPEEIAALLTHADKVLVPFLVICGFAGLRSSEFCRLDWRQVGIGGGKYIEVKARDARKKKQRRLVPIQENLNAWLLSYKSTQGKLWPHSDTYLYEMLADVCAKAKVAWKDNALRHSYISYRVAETGNVAETSLEAGNSPQMIFHNYREVVTPEEAKRWFTIMPAPTANVIGLKAA